MKKQTKKAPAKAKAPDPLKAINQRLRTIDVQTTRLSVSILHRIDDLERLIGMINERIDAQRMEGYALAQAKVDREQHTTKPQGLQPGDYTDASKETADALTAMGMPIMSGQTFDFNYVTLGNGCIQGYTGESGERYTYRTPSEFIASAAVTAKELGLEPVKVEAWVPKVGEWVMVGPFVKGSTGSAVDWPKHPMRVTDLSTSAFYESPVCYLDEPGRRSVACDRVRPATDAEITAHLAKLEAAKPVEFGTWVECEGERWRVACDKVDEWNNWMLAQDAVATWKKRQFFTVLDPQP